MYSKEIKEKALKLLSQGKNAKSVQSILAEENEVTISIPTIYSWKKKARDVSNEEKSSASESIEQLVEQYKIDQDKEAANPNQVSENDTSSSEKDKGETSQKSDMHNRSIDGKRTFKSGKPVYVDKNIELLVNEIKEIKSLINQKLYTDALSLCNKYTTEYYANKYPKLVASIENQKLQVMIGLHMDETALELEEKLEEKYPWNKPYYRIQKIKALVNSYDIKQVMKLTKKYEKDYPEFASAFASLRLQAHLKFEKYDEVLGEIDGLIEKYGIKFLDSLKISALIGLGRYDEAIESSRVYEDEYNSIRKYKNAAIFASQRVTALMKKKQYEEAEKEARIGIKKYHFKKDSFESQIITILIESKGIEEATKAIEIFKKQSPQYSQQYDSQLIEALLSAKQYQEAIEKTRELEEKYRITGGDKFASQRIKALTKLGKLNEAEKDAINSEKKYPKRGEIFATQRIEVLIEKSELEKAITLVREMLIKYPNSKARWSSYIKKINAKIALEKAKKDDQVVETQEQAVSEEAQPSLIEEVSSSKPQEENNIDVPQLKEKPKASLQEILEMSEEEFENYAKTLQDREKLFAVVARCKKQNQDKLAIGYIDMYLKKKENANEALAKQLQTMAKSKTPIFDESKWYTLAKKFNLDFNSGAKTLLNQMIELAKQINNYPFDLQIDSKTLLAIKQLTKAKLNPDYPDGEPRIETER